MRPLSLLPRGIQPPLCGLRCDGGLQLLSWDYIQLCDKELVKSDMRCQWPPPKGPAS